MLPFSFRVICHQNICWCWISRQTIASSFYKLLIFFFLSALTEHPGRARRRLRVGASFSSSRVLPCRSRTVSPSNAGAAAAARWRGRRQGLLLRPPPPSQREPLPVSGAGWLASMSCPVQPAPNQAFVPSRLLRNFSLPALEVGGSGRLFPDLRPILFP